MTFLKFSLPLSAAVLILAWDLSWFKTTYEPLWFLGLGVILQSIHMHSGLKIEWVFCSIVPRACFRCSPCPLFFKCSCLDIRFSRISSGGRFLLLLAVFLLPCLLPLATRILGHDLLWSFGWLQWRFYLWSLFVGFFCLLLSNIPLVFLFTNPYGSPYSLSFSDSMMNSMSLHILSIFYAYFQYSNI